MTGTTGERPGGAAGDADAVRRASRMASLYTPWALRLAVTLRIPDHLAEGPADLARLAAHTGVPPHGLRRLLRHLVLLGVLRRAEGDRYALDDLGGVLRSDHPSGLAAHLDQANPLVRRTDAVVSGLGDAVRAGGPVWESVHGRPFWGDLDAHPEIGDAFGASMAEHATALGRALAAAHDWSGVRHLVDVGGGAGCALAEILRAAPGMRGTLVDLPGTARRAEPVLGAHGLAERAEIVGQSFFDPLPAGADAYLLALIMHDWPDGDCVRILRRCAEAAGPRGRILVAEQIAGHEDDATDPVSTGERDLAMLLLFGGAERDEEEFRVLAGKAGLTLAAITPALPAEGLFLLEFRVPAPSDDPFPAF